MNIDEPVITEDDRKAWDKWKRICLLYSKTKKFSDRIGFAKQIVFDMYTKKPNAYVAWSAGKDSTALTHLICVECGIDARVMSIKDDCDFPGEEGYITRLANQWHVRLDIIKPPFSLQDWIENNNISPGEDIHSRAHEFSRRSFYSVIDKYREGLSTPGVYLGLRKVESSYRLMNANKRGFIYIKKNGETVCQPICNWEHIDVYAYLFVNEIPLLPMYRCIRLSDEPGQVRKSWWLPGKGAEYRTIWLKTYYPSLFNKVKKLIYGSETLA